MDRLVLLTIKAEIEKEIKNIEKLKKELSSIKNKRTNIYLRSKGSILHDFYNCCERIFKKIAFELNGSYDDTERWHKALLYKMTLNIDGLRPQLISEELAGELHDYLLFRHLFRNIYGFELKEEKIGYLVSKHEAVTERLVKELRVFLSFLEKEIKEGG